MMKNLLMLKMLYQQIGEYKRDTILTPIFTALEVLMEIFIPFVNISFRKSKCSSKTR